MKNFSAEKMSDREYDEAIKKLHRSGQLSEYTEAGGKLDRKEQVKEDKRFIEAVEKFYRAYEK